MVCRQSLTGVRKKSAGWDKTLSFVLRLQFFEKLNKIVILPWIFFFFSMVPISAFGLDWVKVKHVADGDTIILENGDVVRYIGIDSPEIDHKTNSAEPYGFEARKFNKNMVLSKNLRLEFDQRSHDHHGRLLAYVFLENGLFVNQAMIENGYAIYMYHKANLKHQGLLLKAQQRAMAAKKGIWKNRREKAPRYLGNINSKRFHIPECSSGKKTASRNRFFFESSWDAFWNGYSPCGQCLRIGDLTSHDP